MTSGDRAGSARDEIALAAARDPRQAPFGVRAADPYPDGVALFFWYATPEDRARALLDHHPFADAEGEEDSGGWAQPRAKLGALLDELGDLRPESADLGDAITAAAYRIEWWGTVDDLRLGDHDVAIDVRSDFHESGLEAGDDAQAVSSRPITDQELDAFVAYLGEWRV